jgi:hypothetical protein
LYNSQIWVHKTNQEFFYKFLQEMVISATIRIPQKKAPRKIRRQHFQTPHQIRFPFSGTGGHKSAGDFTSSTFRIFRPLPSAYPTDLGWAAIPEGTTSKTFSFTKTQTLRQNHMVLQRAALSGPVLDGWGV